MASIANKFIETNMTVEGFLSEFIDFTQTHLKRTFDYKTAFAAVDADCKTSFQQAFQHIDWIDGESVVQAEETTAEEGFNKRFRNIETDLSEMAKDLAQAYVCMAEMRQSLFALLKEVRDEFNRLNTDVYNLYLQGETVTPSKTGPFVGDLVGTLKFMDKDYLTYKYANGEISMLPLVASPTVIGKTPVPDPRVNYPGYMAKWLDEHDDVRQNFKSRAVTKEEMLTKYGDMQVTEGVTVKDVVQILPDGATFKTPGKLVQTVAERTGSALAVSGSRAAVAAGFGVGSDVATVGEAPVERMDGVTAEMSNALKAGGLGTVDALASASPQQVQSALRKGGVSVSKGEAAGLMTTALTISKFR